MRTVALLWIWPGIAFAASLTGTVTDPQGKSISGANISVLRHADTSRREAKSDEQGRFFFGAIDPGEYRLTAESSGFPILTRTIQVALGDTQIENVQFSTVASQNQSITVSADVSDAGLFAPDPAQRIMTSPAFKSANYPAFAAAPTCCRHRTLRLA